MTGIGLTAGGCGLHDLRAGLVSGVFLVETRVGKARMKFFCVVDFSAKGDGGTGGCASSVGIAAIAARPVAGAVSRRVIAVWRRVTAVSGRIAAVFIACTRRVAGS